MGLFDRKPKKQKTTRRSLDVGLGELLQARERLLNRRRAGHLSEIQAAALASIEEALNVVRVPVNLSCAPGADQDRDGVEDTREIREILLSGCCEVDMRPDERKGAR